MQWFAKSVSVMILFSVLGGFLGCMAVCSFSDDPLYHPEHCSIADSSHFNTTSIQPDFSKSPTLAPPREKIILVSERGGAIHPLNLRISTDQDDDIEAVIISQ